MPNHLKERSSLLAETGSSKSKGIKPGDEKHNKIVEDDDEEKGNVLDHQNSWDNPYNYIGNETDRRGLKSKTSFLAIQTSIRAQLIADVMQERRGILPTLASHKTRSSFIAGGASATASESRVRDRANQAKSFAIPSDSYNQRRGDFLDPLGQQGKQHPPAILHNNDTNNSSGERTGGSANKSRSRPVSGTKTPRALADAIATAAALVNGMNFDSNSNSTGSPSAKSKSISSTGSGSKSRSPAGSLSTVVESDDTTVPITTRPSAKMGPGTMVDSNGLTVTTVGTAAAPTDAGGDVNKRVTGIENIGSSEMPVKEKMGADGNVTPPSHGALFSMLTKEEYDSLMVQVQEDQDDGKAESGGEQDGIEGKVFPDEDDEDRKSVTSNETSNETCSEDDVSDIAGMSTSGSAAANGRGRGRGMTYEQSMSMSTKSSSTSTRINNTIVR